MTIAIAADHAGYDLKNELVAELGKLGHSVLDFGPTDKSSVDYPDFAVKVGEAINAQQAQLGLLVCGTGTGMAIAANKIRGIRAAVCRTEYEARMARQHNEANVLCLGQRVTGPGLALEILHAFLNASFEGGRHAARMTKVAILEAKR
jgi:ribose 5-phosphate isomerase B